MTLALLWFTAEPARKMVTAVRFDRKRESIDVVFKEDGPEYVLHWLDIFGVGTNQRMYHKAWDGSAWQPSRTYWQRLCGIFDLI